MRPGVVVGIVVLQVLDKDVCRFHEVRHNHEFEDDFDLVTGFGDNVDRCKCVGLREL